MGKGVSEREMEAFQDFVRDYARKRMRRLEKRLRHYAKLYYGYPVAIVFYGPGMHTGKEKAASRSGQQEGGESE